jgi:hypothetical protein
MPSARALSRRVGALEARKATTGGCWLVEVPPGATEAEVEAAISAHRTATGWTGGIVLTRSTLTIEEWEREYGATIGSN